MKSLLLFDIDGTLTNPRGKISDDMLSLLKQLQQTYDIGVVGGSDLNKQKEQLGKDVLEWVDYSFSENGLVAYKHNQLINQTCLSDHIDQKTINSLINFCLIYIANLD